MSMVALLASNPGAASVFKLSRYVVFSALAALIGMLIETALPSGDRVGRASRVRAGAFYALYIATAAICSQLTAAGMAALSIKPLIDVDLSWSANANGLLWLLSLFVFPLVPVLAFDFFYYWFHRLQHAVPWLWRFHSVHHAARDFHVLTAYHHLSEELLRLPLLFLPMGLLFHATVPHVFSATIFSLTLGRLAHVNSPLSLGPLRYLLVEPRFHRLHHSLERRHIGRNFANAFPLWDALFATARWPAKNEWPEIGVAGRPAAVTLRQFLFPPRL
jgi:sterol desaturase/sphingolipid hydroxylase (fatty acid hydroxylase superfamily)